VFTVTIAVALPVVIATLLFTFTFHKEITGFFRIGDVLPLSPFVNKESVRIVHGEVGYDGQQFLTIALDPTLKSIETIKALDNPIYRYRRIGYPIAGYILGCGKPAIVPYALVALNVGCIIAIFLIVSLLKRGEQSQLRSPSALWVLAFPGIWVCLCLSTADLFGSTLFVAALLLLKARQHFWASVILCGACLTRETYLATVVVLAGFMLVQRKIWVSVLLLCSILLPLLWLAFVNKYIQAGTTGVQESFALPFTGIIDKIQNIAEGRFGLTEAFEGSCFAILIATIVLVTISFVSSRKSLDIVHISVLPCIAILTASSMQILAYHGNYLRVFLDAWVILLLVPDTKRFGYARKTLLLLSGLASLAYVINYIVS